MTTITPQAEDLQAAPIPALRRPTDSAPVALLRYLARPAVHTYAFSVAANVILSLFPFMVLLLTIAHRFLHSKRAVEVIAGMFRALLPTGQEFVVRNMLYLVYSQRKVAIFSVFMLLVSSTGVFLPLEFALNQVWGVTKNRSYFRNQMVSLGLSFAVGLLAMFLGGAVGFSRTAADTPVFWAYGECGVSLSGADRHRYSGGCREHHHFLSHLLDPA